MQGVEFLLLGPVTVRAGADVVAVGGVHSRGVLAALLLEANRVISVDRIIDAVWDNRQLGSARVQAQNRVSALRRVLRGLAPDRAFITTTGSGYLIEVDDDELDTARFTRGVKRAATMADRAAARHALADALALWRGPALEPLSTPYFQAAAQFWEEQRLRALERRMQLDLDLGRHGELVPELGELVMANPFRERCHALLMLALYRTGRQAEALETYRNARDALGDQLGLEPGVLLQRLHTAVLQGEPRLSTASLDEWEDTGAVRISGAAANVAVPRELPAEMAGFVGRLDALDTLTRYVNDSGDAMAVITVTGGAGVGKTALAVRWAHGMCDRFPDGQLFVKLRGHAAAATLEPIEALIQLLQALGVAPERIPMDTDTAARMYRSLLAGKRVLVLIDDAVSADQVRPLLPGGSGCVVLVTSRDRLGGLIAREGARSVSLDVLQPEEAHDLLAQTIGIDRIGAEPEAATALARLCAYLPLALRIAAANLVSRPRHSIDAYAARLREGDRVAELRVDDDDSSAARIAFDLSYVALPAPARRLFRLLGLIPGADFTAEAVAALAGVGLADAAELLDRLAAAHLVQQHSPSRYAFHDLLRLYAAERAQTEDGELDRYAALGRLLEWSLSTVDNASRLLYPEGLRLPPSGRGQPPSGTIRLSEHTDALTWLDAESSNLLAAIRHAVENGPRPIAWRLADALRAYFWQRGDAVTGLAIARAGLTAAELDGSHAGQAATRLSIGLLHWRHDRLAEAVEEHEAALACARRAGWPAAEAAALANLGGLHRHMGKPRAAAQHLTEALAMAAERESSQAAALHGQLGSVYWELGQLKAAAKHHAQAQAIYCALGSHSGQAAALTNLGETHHLLGELDLALAELTEALALIREVGNRHREAETLRCLAAAHGEAGHGQTAVEFGRAALTLARDTKRRRAETHTLITLGTIHRRNGHTDTAAGLYHRALNLLGGTSDAHAKIQSLLGVSAVDTDAGRFESAMRHGLAAHDLAVQLGFRILEAQAHLALGDLHLRQSRPDLAAEHARHALAACRETGHQRGEAAALALLQQAGAHPTRRLDKSASLR